MKQKNRLRRKPVQFMLTDKEHRLFLERMDELGIRNRGEYLRRLIFHGRVVLVDLKGVHEIGRQLGMIGGNINQIAKRVNATGRTNTSDAESITNSLKECLQGFYKLKEELYRITGDKAPL